MFTWFDALPVSVLVLNKHRQIVYCNKAFRGLVEKNRLDEVVGLRPGEALDCVNADAMDAGCGCSEFCRICGAVNAIIKSLDGESDCQHCKLMRRCGTLEVPLDLQVFSEPIEFQGETYSILTVLDVSHEMRMRYMERTFFHGLINAAGGMSNITRLVEVDPNDTMLLPLLIDCSNRILRDVLFHRDVRHAESNTLVVNKEALEAQRFFERLIKEECRIRNIQPTIVNMDIPCEQINSDKRILGHVVRIMLSNAIEACGKTCDRIDLKCRCEDDGSVSIQMSNPGVMPDDIQKELYKRYVTTKEPDRGLGVYVLRLFVQQALGGDVSFVSKDGHTSFSIHLP